MGSIIQSFFIRLQQIASLTKSGSDLQIVLKNHRESFHKVQRKLRLVVSERDCYKQLIENYEKNVTSKELRVTRSTRILTKNPLFYSFRIRDYGLRHKRSIAYGNAGENGSRV